MAKKKKTESVEGEGAEDEAPKSKKKLIIMVTVIVLIGGFAAKSILLKPKPPTPAQVAAAAELADLKLENTCAAHNGLPTKPLPADAADAKAKDSKGSTTTTTIAAADKMPAGPVDSLDAITINLAAGHYLKVGIALQVPAGMDPKEISKTENWEAVALKTAIDKLSGQTLDALGDRRQVEENLIGDSVCRQTEGKVLTVYFTDFVMQ